MERLDDASFISANDPHGMFALTQGFVDQCRQALSIARSAPLPNWSAKPDSVALTGLGGSAAGGDFVRALFEDAGPCPFFVNRDYAMPNFVGSGSLVFACSYSGQTEETIASYLDARSKGASIIVVSSGGQLSEMARKDGFPVVTVPGGQPPRTALGYLLVPVVYACESLGLLPKQDWDGLFATLDAGRAAWDADVPVAENPTKALAQALHGKLPTIYGLGGWPSVVAGRWKGQLNENAKAPAFANAFPELCHNEIVGWEGAEGFGPWASVVLEGGAASAKMRARAQVTAGLIADVAETHTVEAKGGSLLAKMLYLAYFGDFVSLYLAALREVDPEAIEPIHKLKAELAKID